MVSTPAGCPLHALPAVPPCSVLRKVPDMLESFAERAPALLEDRSHSVLLAGVTLMLDICAQAPQVGLFALLIAGLTLA